MDDRAIQSYLAQLRELKDRGRVFLYFSRNEASALYGWASLEMEALQLQGILDAIAFCFVLYIGEKAIPPYIGFVKYRNPSKYLEDLKEIDAQFYPRPIFSRRGMDGNYYWDSPPAENYLREEDFVNLFEHCRRVLRPSMPGESGVSPVECKSANKKWFAKIVRLMNEHAYGINEEKVHLFQTGAENEEPKFFAFQQVNGNDAEVERARVPEHSDDVTLQDHFRRQISYLRRSCELFDAGHLDEALRIAVVIRVLLHDTRSSESLLHQMGVKDALKIVSSFGFSEDFNEQFESYLIYPVFGTSSGGGTSVPFSLENHRELPFDTWWNEVVWKQDSELTRRKIILDAANKEGGAHVQADPPESVVELRRGMREIISVKIGGVEVGSPLNYHFVLLRQFAHELLNSKDFLKFAC